MDYENLVNIAKSRRSIRRYTKKPVPEDMILKILEVARWAPSASNTQPWEWIVVTDKEKLSTLLDILSERIAVIRRINPKFPVHNITYFENLSAVIVVCFDARVKNAWSPNRADHLLQVSMATAIQNVLLAATSLGIASVWVSGADVPEVQQKIRQLFDIPNNVSPFICIPLGYAASPPQSRYRRQLEDTVHWNKFDISKMRSDDEMQPTALWKKM